jgi:hypothetical protein
MSSHSYKPNEELTCHDLKGVRHLENYKTFDSKSSTQKEDRWSWSGGVAGYAFFMSLFSLETLYVFFLMVLYFP